MTDPLHAALIAQVVERAMNIYWPDYEDQIPPRSLDVRREYIERCAVLGITPLDLDKLEVEP